MARLLVIDDAFHEVRDGLHAVLQPHEVVGATDGAAGLNALRTDSSIDVVLLDLRMPAAFGSQESEEGLAVFEELRRVQPDVPVIFLSAFDDLRIVNRALTRGAFWYLKKPPDLEETRNLVQRAVAERVRRRDERELRAASAARGQAASDTASYWTGHREMVGESAVLHRLHAEIAAVAPTEVSVLIHGESGVGKELAAREIHRLSRRRDAPFEAVNCGEMNDDSLAQARLFGHGRGSFTGALEDRPGLFELARGGTLFFDEVGDLGLDLQGKLLRVLQEREVTRLGAGERPRPVDVRLLFASHRNLGELVTLGRFRDDLRFRIQVGVLRVPPLRERLEDLTDLVPALLARAVQRDLLPECEVDPDIYLLLSRYAWPGNVRELENVLKRAALRAASQGTIRATHIAFDPIPGIESEQSASAETDRLYASLLDRHGFPGGIRALAERHGKDTLRCVLRRAEQVAGNWKRAGLLLGLIREENLARDYDNLRYWLKALGLRREAGPGRGPR